jgi:hypothetical protein
MVMFQTWPSISISIVMFQTGQYQIDGPMVKGISSEGFIAHHPSWGQPIVCPKQTNHDGLLELASAPYKRLDQLPGQSPIYGTSALLCDAMLCYASQSIMH